MQLSPLVSDAPAIVYIDFKSPYAYLAVEPTRQLEQALGLQFDWRPFVLDIPSYLGSARLGKSGEVVEAQRSPEQWSGVKYAYYDCRRYGSLYGLRIRGTEKIWDTNLVSAAMLWTRSLSFEATARFINRVYPPFWVRDLDLEREDVIKEVLDDCELDGQAFLRWAHDEGLAMNADFQHAAFAAGIYGVPSYVVDGECYFGREHLPRVRWHLEGRRGDAPDIANVVPETMSIDGSTPGRVVVGVDDSLDSVRAVPQLRALLKGYQGAVSWVRIPPRKSGSAVLPDEDHSRSAMHQRFRRAAVAANERRYGVLDQGQTNYGDLISEMLRAAGIPLEAECPEQVLRPAMPGVVVLLDDEIFIGRQHLPLIAKKLGVTP
ncbi:DsbA family protein [Congregibacter litoralis]|uniref:2-hydroxychromene-2-carboxylate isomerase n=1 Tax=Congregibacter litoralis KT71 TaxID=314285 RepID=A4AA33_9GAMM|nr:DsbA family protein [Congregibacter litoralis]EAQ97350.1 2-hydroxychromene-2-carboxylate isomerase [Congregibacter litoralis KT71]